MVREKITIRARLEALRGVAGAVVDQLGAALPTELRGNGAQTTHLVGEQVIRRGAMQLLRFAPQNVSKEPILFVYSFINRYYVLDFMPGRSVLEFFVRRGHPCYVLDWGQPSLAERHRRVEDYVCRDLGWAQRALALRERKNTPLDCEDQEWGVILREPLRPVHVFGYCMGGTLAAMYAAMNPASVRSLVLLATPIDFHDDELLARWTRSDVFDVDQVVDTLGNVPTWLLELGFRSMSPMVNLTKWRDLWTHRHRHGFTDVWRRMEQWSQDNVAFPGELYRSYIKELYQKNSLHLGQLSIDGKSVDLSAIRCQTLAVLGKRDDIVSNRSARAIQEHLPSTRLKMLEMDTGHLGLTTSGKARHVIWPQIAEWYDTIPGNQETSC